MIKKILNFLNKYWVVLAACGTILSTGTVAILKLADKIDKDIATITSLNQWVSDHDDDIQVLKDDVNKLKEDQRLRELGICK